MTHAARSVIQKVESNAYFRRAVDSEEYRSAVALREQALDRRTDLPAVNQPPEPTKRDELDSWLNAVTEARAAEQTRELQYQALTSLVGICDARIAAVIDSDPDQVLGVLSDDMTALMAEVATAVTKLNGATSPSEAIAGGVVDTWNEMGALRANYDTVRDAQRFVMGAEISHYSSDYLYDDQHASRLYIRNIDTVFPGWKTPDTSRVNLSGVPQDPRPWPTDDNVSQLVWLATHAELWIPTSEDLRVLEQELHRKHNPEPQVIPGRPDKPKQTFGNAMPRRASIA